MIAANRVRSLFSQHPFENLSSLLLKELGSHFSGLEANLFGRHQYRVWVNENAVNLEFDLPGYQLSDFDVSLEQDRLTIKAQSDDGNLPEETKIRVRERMRAPIQLEFQLPFRADPDQIEVTYCNGVLNFQVPRPAEDQPRKLEVKPASPQE